jgi:hypothetical protein
VTEEGGWEMVTPNSRHGSAPHSLLTCMPKLRDSAERNPSPGSLLSPPSHQRRGLKSIRVDSPLPWGEGGPQPALSSAGAGRVRGDFRKIQTPVPFSRFIKAGKSDSTVGLRMPIQLRNAGSNAANPRRVCRRHEACRDDTRLNPIKAARDALA